MIDKRESYCNLLPPLTEALAQKRNSKYPAYFFLSFLNSKGSIKNVFVTSMESKFLQSSLSPPSWKHGGGIIFSFLKRLQENLPQICKRPFQYFGAIFISFDNRDSTPYRYTTDRDIDMLEHQVTYW